MMKRILCAACISLLSLQAFAGDVEDNLKKFETALQKNAAQPPKAEGEKPQQPDIVSLALPRVRQCIAEHNLRMAIEILQQLNAAALSNLNAAQLSDETKKASSDLLSALLKEQEARQKAATDAVESVITRATDAVRTAKTPTDLDPILAELAQLKNQSPEPGRYDDFYQRNRMRAEGAYRFVAKWQDYLAARADRNQNRIRSVVQTLSSMEVLLMPRSEILAKAQEQLPANPDAVKAQQQLEAAADQIVAKAKTLDDAAKVIPEMRNLAEAQRAGNIGPGNLQPYVQALEDIDKTYREFQSGLPVNASMLGDNRRTPASLLPLRNQLLFLILPRYINAPADVKPKPGEGVADFLNRVVREAKDSGSIELAIRARKALRRMEHSSPNSKIENQALQGLQAAQNQEQAGQWELAVVSYQDTLKIGSDIVPVKWIGSRLADIKKNHPQEFQKGMELSLKSSNPAPADAGTGASE